MQKFSPNIQKELDVINEQINFKEVSCNPNSTVADVFGAKLFYAKTLLLTQDQQNHKKAHELLK